MEFCQWLKAFFEKNYNGNPYDAIERRKGQDLHYLGGATVAPVKKSAGGMEAKKSFPTAAVSKPMGARPVVKKEE